MRIHPIRVQRIAPMHPANRINRQHQTDRTYRNNFTKLTPFLTRIVNHYKLLTEGELGKITPTPNMKITINSDLQRREIETTYRRFATAENYENIIADYREEPPRKYENNDPEKPTYQQEISDFTQEITSTLKTSNIETIVDGQEIKLQTPK